MENKKRVSLKEKIKKYLILRLAPDYYNIKEENITLSKDISILVQSKDKKVINDVKCKYLIDYVLNAIPKEYSLSDLIEGLYGGKKTNHNTNPEVFVFHERNFNKTDHSKSKKQK